MIIDNNFNNTGNNFKGFRNNNEPNITNRLHSNQGNISADNNLLTKEISTFAHTDPTNTQDMADKSVAMLQQRYKNRLINSDSFYKKCNDIAKNRQ